jgi:hypothetical protein
VVGADIRRGEWGSKFPTDLVRGVDTAVNVYVRPRTSEQWPA